MNWLQKAGAVAALNMIGLPVALETMPIAFFGNLGDVLIWYATAIGLIGLVGWSLGEEK